MSPAWAYQNGRFIAAAELQIAPTDSGFLLGVTVAEQLRTFRGQLFRLESHLQRLQRSLQIVGLELPLTFAELETSARDLVGHNHQLLDPADDLGLTIFVTPGTYSSYLQPNEKPTPQIGMHTTPLPFHHWADKYEQGDALALPQVRQVPSNCWPTELKVRSRVHYYLADKEARQRFPGSRAVLLDQSGYVTESTTASVLIVTAEQELVSPPAESVLPGVSAAVVLEIAESLGIAIQHRPVLPHDLETAAEILLCSTSPCVWPVVAYEGKPVGNGTPGAVFRRILAGWNELVGMDIPVQAQRFAIR